jgi:hypothetical protein
MIFQKPIDKRFIETRENIWRQQNISEVVASLFH